MTDEATKVCPRTGKPIRTHGAQTGGTGRYARWMFPLVGVAAIAWFLLRVLPKPSRVTYPCQRVAAGLGAGFISYVVGLASGLLALRRILPFVRERRPRALVVVGCAGLAVTVTLSLSLAGLIELSEAAFVSSGDKANQPIGVPRGVRPGRVAWARDPQVVSWPGDSSPWWEDRYWDQARVDAMLADSLETLANIPNEARAWQSIFEHFNAQHGRGSRGYRAGESIAIKINQNNTVQSKHRDNKYVNGSPHLVLALVRSLVEQGGVSADKITVFDASRYVTDNIYDKVRAVFPQVKFVDHAGGEGRIKTTYAENALPFSIDNGAQARGLATCVVEAHYVINMAILKGHTGMGVTFCGKNWFGATSIVPSPKDNAHNHFNARGTGGKFKYLTFVDFMGHKDLGEKTVLFLVDFLLADKDLGGPPGPRWKMAPFNGGWPASLLSSLDGVAVDSVALDFFRAEFPDAPDMEYSDMYLHEAALANDPPSGTKYDPERDGTRLRSLGVHEHWNNPKDKQYAGNLGRAGIELVSAGTITSGGGPSPDGGAAPPDASAGVPDVARADAGGTGAWDGGGVGEDAGGYEPAPDARGGPTARADVGPPNAGAPDAGPGADASAGSADEDAGGRNNGVTGGCHLSVAGRAEGGTAAAGLILLFALIVRRVRRACRARKHGHLVLVAVLSGLVGGLLGCDVALEPEDGADGEPDRGRPADDRGGVPDRGEPDRGASVPDRGEPDRGASVPDRGEPDRGASAPEGGVSDAAPEPDDAGTGGGGTLRDVLPFVQPPLATLARSPRIVFAHWHNFPISRDNKDPRGDTYQRCLTTAETCGVDKYVRTRPLARPVRAGDGWQVADARSDILQAQAIGVDAFLMNVFDNDTNPWQYPTYINYLKAAKALNTGFKVGVNVDCSKTKTNGGLIGDLILRFLKEHGEFNNPHQWRHAGKFVLGSFNTFNCSATFWADVKARLKAGGLGDVFFVSVALGGAYRADYDPVVDAWTDWGRKDPGAASRVDYAKLYAEAGDEPVAASISHGDARIFTTGGIGYESEGSATLRANWDRAIQTGADWAQLITWNDIGEHAAFYPNTAEQFAFYDMTAYYITWFKTGRAPAINKDALYYFHRRRAVPLDGINLRAGSWKNEIELVGFLTAPGTLEIVTSSGTTRREVPAGLQVLRAPLPPSGRPRFRLVRGGDALIDLTSAFSIDPAIGRDYIYRAGGSLRAAYGATRGTSRAACEAPAAAPDACFQRLGEPVWLVY